MKTVILAIITFSILGCSSFEHSKSGVDSYIIVEGNAGFDIPIEGIDVTLSFIGQSNNFNDSRNQRVEDIQKTFKVLKYFGIADSNYYTSKYEMSETPKYDEENYKLGKYQFEYSLNVEINNPKIFEKLMDSLGNYNLKSFEIDGFSNNKHNKYLELCYENALKDSRKKADIILSKSGQKVGKIYKILSKDGDPFKYYESEKAIIDSYSAETVYTDYLTMQDESGLNLSKNGIFIRKTYNLSVTIIVLYTII